MAKARKFLDDARANLKMGRLDTALDRAYYAMYHAARAMLQHYDIPLPKTHSGLRSVLGHELVKPGIVSRRYFQSLARGAQIREEVTYTVYAHHGQEAVENMVREADWFVSMAERTCRTGTPGKPTSSSKAA